MKGKGVNNLAEFPDSSPSPRPSPLKGEGAFLTLYESVKDDEAVKSKISPAQVGGHPGRWKYTIKLQLDSGFRRNDGSFSQLRNSFSKEREYFY
jgi:23S rRNA C2498 (ribose-2'-O)-methylase RlmM